jgi:hypothetical protein
LWEGKGCYTPLGVNFYGNGVAGDGRYGGGIREKTAVVGTLVALKSLWAADIDEFGGTIEVGVPATVGHVACD